MMKIGIIGMSTGNAHPYSWSAIINGKFEAQIITDAGYPGVATYLESNKDTLGIDGARVTHVWAQEKAIAQSIAKAAGIDQVVANMEDMIGHVDAVILARDDPEFHADMAKPFIDAGIPLFIDKPLAITRQDLDYFSAAHAAGKFIMSCSSVRYANECRTAKTELQAMGKLQLITAVGKKDWSKYGVHVLEGIFALLDDQSPLSVQHIGTEDRNIVRIEFEDELVAIVHVYMDIAPTFQISVFGEKAWRLIEIKNSYSMFRDNIIEFIRSVREGRPRLTFDKTVQIIRTLIAAVESREQGGKKIDLSTSF